MKGNTMQLIFDIETIPSQHPDARAQARELLLQVLQRFAHLVVGFQQDIVH